jgi:hypothetical protein
LAWRGIHYRIGRGGRVTDVSHGRVVMAPPVGEVVRRAA